MDINQPVNSSLVGGRSKKSFGTVKMGETGKSKTSTITNSGTAPLTGMVVSIADKHKKDVALTTSARIRLSPGTSTTFKVHFKPTSQKTRDASVFIRGNDANEDPFDIRLTGLGAAR